MLSRVVAAAAPEAPRRQTVVATDAPPPARPRRPHPARRSASPPPSPPAPSSPPPPPRHPSSRHRPPSRRTPTPTQHEHAHAHAHALEHATRSRARTRPRPRPRRSPSPRPAPPRTAMGTISVNASPWATVHVNGKLAGTTPILRFPVRAGRASVTIENPKLGRKQVDVKIEPKKDTPLIVDLHADRRIPMSDDAKRPPDAATRTLAGPRTLAFPKVRLKVLKGPDKGKTVTLERGRDPDRRRRQRAPASHRSDRVAQPLRHPHDGQGAAAARSRLDQRQPHRGRRGARGLRARAARRWSSGTRRSASMRSTNRSSSRSPTRSASAGCGGGRRRCGACSRSPGASPPPTSPC